MNAIIGNGCWAKRIHKFTHNSKLINPKQGCIDLTNYDNIYICVSSMYIDEVLNKIKWGEHSKIISCVKGLMNNGQTVCQYLKFKLNRYIQFMGGANINDGYEDCRVIDGEKLELLGILKNVYAIGFGYYLNKSENLAANYLSKCVKELVKYGIQYNYLDDLFVSCFSNKGRNRTCGLRLAKGKKIKGTIEGLRTIEIIKEYNLFKKLLVLRSVCNLYE